MVFPWAKYQRNFPRRKAKAELSAKSWSGGATQERRTNRLRLQSKANVCRRKGDHHLTIWIDNKLMSYDEERRRKAEKERWRERISRKNIENSENHIMFASCPCLVCLTVAQLQTTEGKLISSQSSEHTNMFVKCSQSFSGSSLQEFKYTVLLRCFVSRQIALRNFPSRIAWWLAFW